MPNKSSGESDGDSSDDEPSRVESLGEIFTDIADDETFVDEQNQRQTETRLLDGTHPGEYVGEMLKTTGLSETIGEGETEHRLE